MIEAKFNQARKLIDAAESKAVKGVAMQMKRPVVEARRMIRQAKDILTEISKEINERVEP